MPCVCMATEKFPDRTVRYAMSPSTKVAGNCVNALPGSPQLLLLDQLGDRIRFKHYSMRTEQAYSDWMRRFGLFHNKRHAREMGVREVGFPHLPCCHGALRRQPRTRRRVRSPCPSGFWRASLGLMTSSRHHVEARGIKRAMRPALRQAAISKRVTPHSLRHYAESRTMPYSA